MTEKGPGESGLYVKIDSNGQIMLIFVNLN